jgi:PAS domain S-box-containing protein
MVGAGLPHVAKPPPHYQLRLIPQDALPSQNQNALVNSICMKLLEARGAEQVIPGGRMSTPAINSELFEPPRFPTRHVLHGMAVLLVIAVVPFLVWPVLAARILASNFLPHVYCYLGKPGLVWTHVVADSLIGLSYVMISGTLGYLAQKGRGDIPFQWMFLAFGAFIVACGGTHFMEVVTVWVPVYVLSAGLKVVTALVSMTTAVLLPFTVPRVLCLIQTAKASEATEAKFHQIADSIQEIFWMVDAITMQAIYVNPAFEQITGRTCASLQEAPLSYQEIIHPDDRARVLRRLHEAQITGKFDEEFRITRPDGTIRWVGAQGFPVRDAQKKIYRLAGVVQDVTERKRADEVQLRLAAIVESSDDAVISKDLRGVIMSWNAAAQRIFGYTAAEAVGQSITIIIPPEMHNEETQILRRLQAGEHIQHYETSRLTKQGNRVDVSLTISPMRDSAGRVVGASKIARDITERKRAEEALRRSEAEARSRAEELAVILDAVPGMALIAQDPACRKITGSRAAYDMLRLPYGANISKSAPEEERPSTFRVTGNGEFPVNELPIQKAAATGQEVRESEIALVFDDGTSRAMLGNAAPLLDDKGAVRGAVGVFVDITERKRVEEALRESEDRYRDLVEHSQDLLCTHDLDGKLVSTNPEPARILGYEVAELLKIPMRDLIAPEYREQFDRYLLRVRTAGMDKGLMAVVTRTGERRIWEYHNTLRTEGVPSPIVRGMAHDVTDRIRAEREVRASEERFRQLAENIREVFYLTDLQSHRTLYISPAYEEVWGRTCQSLYEDMKSFLDSIHPDDRDAVLRAYVSHSPFLREYRIFRPDGSMRWICDRGFPIRNEKGQVYRLAGIAEDITERKRAEHALQESQAALARVTRIATMGELAASIAHEINQPLGAVVTNGGAALHWMAGQPPNLEETREAIERTIREAKRASDVIGRIRALLQKAPPQMKRLDLNAVIREVLALVDNELLSSGVRVQTELARDVAAVLGDRVQLRQVMLNLILNGIEAMSTITDRPRELRIRSARHPDGVLIQVQDSGKGVDPDQADRIFESFFTTKPQGIGMGLSISRSMVEAHGGRLWFTPGSSYGAVFQFTVPETGQAS